MQQSRQFMICIRAHRCMRCEHQQQQQQTDKQHQTMKGSVVHLFWWKRSLCCYLREICTWFFASRRPLSHHTQQQQMFACANSSSSCKKVMKGVFTLVHKSARFQSEKLCCLIIIGLRLTDITYKNATAWHGLRRQVCSSTRHAVITQPLQVVVEKCSA
jgi:hypothetical protein